MKKKKGFYKLENVKLKAATVATLRENKEKTGIPITTFVEQAVAEKLNKQSK